MAPTPREQPDGTARALLEGATTELAPKPHANPLVPLVADGRADRRALAALAQEQCRVIPADRRSFLHLAGRSGDAGLAACAAFFGTLAEGEGVALDRLGPLLTACEVSAERAAAYDPMAGCQAYPAYVAWLALNAEPADAVLALTANFAAWGGYCGTIAGALRTHYGFSEEACGFFDFFAEPAPDVDRAGLAALQEGIDRQCLTPPTALRQGRLLQDYEEMFWGTLAGLA
ncbi:MULTISPECIES: transcriptional regulator [Streptomyces]|uniref:Transcriptional regulator n=1 Tax=Streptomyces lasiicapitis TaxID=1923961 RepID=A0ABQ2LMF1_9ACTN|nr:MULTISPECIES: transcriptional regulator [Streptomyces]QIB47094.1 transcriptional regulator [Streptomyces aureoverticillatus]GGO39992.1 hypothetical protein GCM10012286_17370 [Streptomyces lasiicapitis]